MLKKLEEELLLDFAVTDLGIKKKGNPSIKDKIDWNYIFEKVAQNRIFPLFYRKITGDSLTRQMRNQCINPYYTFLTRNLNYYEELGYILKVFQNQNIQFMPIRGVALAETVYPNKHERYLSDIDILLPSCQEVYIAYQALTKIGFRNFWDSTQGIFGRMLGISGYTANKLHGRTKINIEIKSYVPNWLPFLKDQELESEIWRTSKKTTIEGVDVPIMSPENMLLVLCLHSFNKKIFTLRDLSDVTYILKKYPDFNWSYILELSRKKTWPYILNIPLTFTNLAVSRLYEIALIPQGILKEINRNEILKSILPYSNNILAFPIIYYYRQDNSLKIGYTPFFFTREQKNIQSKKIGNRILDLLIKNIHELYLIIYFIENTKLKIRFLLSRLFKKLLTFLKIFTQFNLIKKINN